MDDKTIGLFCRVHEKLRLVFPVQEARKAQTRVESVAAGRQPDKHEQKGKPKQGGRHEGSREPKAAPRFMLGSSNGSVGPEQHEEAEQRNGRAHDG